MSYHFMIYDERDCFNCQRRNSSENKAWHQRWGKHVCMGYKTGRIRTHFSYSYISFSFSAYCLPGIGLSTHRYFSFPIVFTQNTQPCIRHTVPMFQFLSSVSTQNREKHHHFLPTCVIIISSNFFNQCHWGPELKDFFSKKYNQESAQFQHKMPFPLNLTVKHRNNFWSAFQKIQSVRQKQQGSFPQPKKTISYSDL